MHPGEEPRPMLECGAFPHTGVCYLVSTDGQQVNEGSYSYDAQLNEHSCQVTGGNAATFNQTHVNDGLIQFLGADFHWDSPRKNSDDQFGDEDHFDDCPNFMDPIEITLSSDVSGQQGTCKFFGIEYKLINTETTPNAVGKTECVLEEGGNVVESIDLFECRNFKVKDWENDWLVDIIHGVLRNKRRPNTHYALRDSKTVMADGSI